MAAFIATTVALVSAPPASSHGSFLAPEVCGPDECRSLGDGLYLYREHGEFEEHDFDLAPVPPAGSYYELAVRDFPERAFFIPEPGVVYLMDVNGPWLWIALNASDIRWLRSVTDGLDSHELEPESVLVKGEEAEDPGVYAELYGSMPRTPAPPTAAERFEIVVLATRRTPWTEDFNRFVFVPASNVLKQGEEWVQVTPAVAERVERDAGLLPAEPGGSRALLLSVLGGVLALAAAAAVFGLRARR